MDDVNEIIEDSVLSTLNTTITLCTPDVVSSCDLSTAQDSLGILSQGEMAEFSNMSNSEDNKDGDAERVTSKRSFDETYDASKPVPSKLVSTMNSTIVVSKEKDHHALPNLEMHAEQNPPQSSSTQEEEAEQSPSNFLLSSVPCHSTPLTDLSECLEMVDPLTDGIGHEGVMAVQDPKLFTEVELVLSKNSNIFEASANLGPEPDARKSEVPISNSKVKAIKLMGGCQKSGPAMKPKLATKPNFNAQRPVQGPGILKPKIPLIIQRASGLKEQSARKLSTQNSKSSAKEMPLAKKSSAASHTSRTKSPLLKLAPVNATTTISKSPVKQSSVKSVSKLSLASSASNTAPRKVSSTQAAGSSFSRQDTLKVQSSKSSLSSTSNRLSSTIKSTSLNSASSKPSILLKSGSLLSIRNGESKLTTTNLKKTSSILSSGSRIASGQKNSKNVSENKSSSKPLQKSVSNLSASRQTTSSVLKSTTSSTSIFGESKTQENNNLPKSKTKPRSSLGNSSKSSLSTFTATGARPKQPDSNVGRKTSNVGIKSTLTSNQNKAKGPVKSPNLTPRKSPSKFIASNSSRLTVSNSFVAREVTTKPSLPPRSLSNVISDGKQRSSTASKPSDVKSFPSTRRMSFTRPSTSTVTPNSRMERAPSSNLLTPRCSQPDLVKTSTPRSDLQKEVTSLQSCLAVKVKDVDHFKMIAKANIVGFDALAIVVKNLLVETEKVQSLKYSIEAYESRSQSLQLEIDNSKLKHKTAEEDFNKVLFQLGKDIETMCSKHEEEKESMKDAHRCQLGARNLDHQEEMRKWRSKNERDLALLRENHQEEILSLEQSKETSLASERALLDEKEAELKNNFENEENKLVQKIQQLESKVSALVISLMNGPDHRDGVIAETQKEIDSLRAVVEMRNEEVKTVTEEKQRLCQKLCTFEEMKDKVQNLSSQVEDMKELLAVKRSNERKLDAELQQLQESMQKQSREKGRLSMEKEQLEWRMKQRTPLQRCLVQENQSQSFSGETLHTRGNFKTFHVRSPSLNCTEPLPLQSCPLDFSTPSSCSTPSVVDYRTSRASVSYQLELSDNRTPDCARTGRRVQRRLDTGRAHGDRQ